ncbi:MAG: hypothetical protein WCO35_03475 [Candidatus Nomurabacteria bacterium]
MKKLFVLALLVISLLSFNTQTKAQFWDIDYVEKVVSRRPPGVTNWVELARMAQRPYDPDNFVVACMKAGVEGYIALFLMLILVSIFIVPIICILTLELLDILNKIGIIKYKIEI